MKKLLVITMLVFVFCDSMMSQKLILWDMNSLEKINYKIEYKNVKKKIIKSADIYLKHKSVSVTDREKSFAPDIHHYESIGRYHWPDPENPNGPWIRKDGVVNPDCNKYDKALMIKMRQRVEYLALAYYMTLDDKYYDAATEHIRVWFVNNETRMYPMMEYGQIVPGRNGNKGHDSGLIEMYTVIHPVLESVRLLNNIKKIDNYTYEGLQKWCKAFVVWCDTSSLGRKEKAAQNNHGIALDVTMLNMALFANYKECVDKICKDFLDERLKKQISSDGSMPKEAVRATSYNYHIYNLTHIIDYCIIMESLNKHFYRKNRKIIDRAIDYLLRYVGKQEYWPYKEISNWSKHENELLFQICRLNRLEGASKYKKYQEKSFENLERIINS